MNIQMMVRQVPIAFTAIGLFWANSALAQTPVSTYMHLSGSCSKCDLSDRVMPGMSLQGSNFSGSDFSNSNLAGANFSQANLDNTSFYKAYLMRVKGVRVNLNKAILRGTTLSDVRLINSNFANTDLHKADLTGGEFTGSDFTKAKLKSSDAMGAMFSGANFTKAKLDHSDFTGSDFTNAHFLDTKFGDANVKNADFSGANFSGAEMVDITGLTQTQLDVACGSQETQLPEGYSMRVCPNEQDMQVEASALSPMPSPPVVGITLLPKSPRPMLTPKKVRRKNMLLIRSAELDDLMRSIDGVLNDMPAHSTARTKLVKTRNKLVVMQAQIGDKQK